MRKKFTLMLLGRHLPDTARCGRKRPPDGAGTNNTHAACQLSLLLHSTPSHSQVQVNCKMMVIHLALLASAAAANPFTEPMATFISDTMAAWHVPGMALAVVDGSSIYTEVSPAAFPFLSLFFLILRPTDTLHCQTPPRPHPRSGSAGQPQKRTSPQPSLTSCTTTHPSRSGGRHPFRPSSPTSSSPTPGPRTT